MNRFNNPVLYKEFKLRFRSGKSFFGLLFYLLSLGILVIGFIYVQSFSSRFGYFRPEESRWMFYFLSFLQLILVLFIIPGLTAGVISGEREKQTLNILLTTTQSSFSIIIGKLLSSVSYLLILLFSSLPLYSFVFLYGGVSPGQLMSIFLIYLVTIFGIGSLGILFSTLIRKTIAAMVTSYSVMLFLAVGTGILFLLSMAISNNLSSTGPHPVPYMFAVINPFVVTLTLLEPQMAEEINDMMFNIDIPLWLPYMFFYVLVFVFSTILSVKKLRPKMSR